MAIIIKTKSFEDVVYATLEIFKQNLDTPISKEQIHKQLHDDRWSIVNMWKIERALQACINLGIISYFSADKNGCKYITSEKFSNKVKLSEEKAKQYDIKLAEKLLKKRLKEL